MCCYIDREEKRGEEREEANGACVTKDVCESDGMACVSDPLFGTAKPGQVQHHKQAFLRSGSITSIGECVSAIFMSLCVAIKYIYR